MDVLDDTALVGVVALALAFVVALADWRKGLVACIAVGFLQDPLRKLWPGESIYLSALVGVVFAVGVLVYYVVRTPGGTGTRSAAVDTVQEGAFGGRL